MSTRRSWDGATLAARVSHIAEIFVAHPLLARAIKMLNQRKELRVPANRGRGILFIAPADGGKTSFIKYLASQNPPRIVTELADKGDASSYIERTEWDLVAITIPNPCNQKNCANAILEALQQPDCQGTDRKRQSKLAMTQLSIARTVFLAVDNVQDIPELRGPKGTSNIGNLFRDIIDKCNIVVLFFGTASAEIVISANEQLRKRVPAPLRLGAYDVSTPSGLASAMRLAHQIDEELPLSLESGLGSGSLGRGLACAADGKVGAMIDIIISSIRYTVAAQRECMTREDLSSGYKDYYLDYANTVDPFHPEFKARRLILPGEPHFTRIDVR